jgi:hypothetical protein
MYSREQQAAPLPMDPNFANGQILERTAKQKFIIDVLGKARKAVPVAIVLTE